jgi:hypothetical protein
VILVDSGPADVEALLMIYLARGGAAPSAIPTAVAPQPPPGDDALPDLIVADRTVTPEMLHRQLDRNDAVGRAGERVAYAEEIARLSALGCPNPAACVQIVADDNVAAGYDIHSSWNDEIRCIEVKSSTQVDNDFFLTANERAMLAKLGQHAWIYRVRVEGDGNGEVVQRSRDPMSKIPEIAMQPVVWRVDPASLPTEN